ncbi:MAG: hypothetical protein H6742_05560 [Alphaproteobacteria bacterium]|nr:hypothetical protein [Alphaproteobacteria bacterium]
MIALLALCAALFGQRGRHRLGAGLLGLGAAALWVPVLDGGLAAAVVLGLAIVGAALPAGPLGRAPLLVAGLGAVEALRLALLGHGSDGALLAVGGVVVAGAASAPSTGRAGRAAVVAVVLGAAVAGVRGGVLVATPPDDRRAVVALATLDGLDRHADALAERPALGLWALTRDPTAHGVALALLPELGPLPVVGAGWAPEGARDQLDEEDRRAVAEALERQGRGGEALRLLRGAPDDQSRWLRLRLARSQGVALVLEPLPAAPAGVSRLPGRIELGWALLSNGGRQLVFHADGPLRALVLHVRGQDWRGPPHVEIRLDGEVVATRAVPSDGTLELPGPLEPGPHELSLSFIDDARGEGGDRNVWVDAIEGR